MKNPSDATERSRGIFIRTRRDSKRASGIQDERSEGLSRAAGSRRLVFYEERSKMLSRGDRILMYIKYLIIAGLLFDMLGAFILARGLIINKKQAIELGVSRVSGDSDKSNLKLPQVQDRISQSKNAKWGLFFLLLGFTLQILGSLLK